MKLIGLNRVVLSIPKFLGNASFKLLLFPRSLFLKVRNNASYYSLFKIACTKKSSCLKPSISKKLGYSLLLAASTSGFASDNSGGNDDAMNNIATYLLNLGQYLGYNVQVSPTNSNNSTGTTTTVSENLLNLSNMQTVQIYLINSFLGAFPLNTAAGTVGSFVPSNNLPYSNFNGLANFTFIKENSSGTDYSHFTPAQITISPLIDQPEYQTDPVSQSILNILGTPDYSYCLNNDGTTEVSPCNYSDQANLSNINNTYKVLLNVLGKPLPGTNDYFSYNYNKPVIGQLNVNSLVGPLLYSIDNAQASSTSSPTSQSDDTTPGLVANNQAQQAANFIRYVSGLVSPLALPKRAEYDALSVKSQNSNNPPLYTFMEQQQATSTLASYLLSVRMYAANISVGISNLYYILAKRMPQNLPISSNNKQPTSQALSEYTMATWRLFNPDNSSSQWLSDINKASDATVKKEIAGLLAEINYQLYLGRVIQERILLTNSILVLQNARTSLAPPQTVGEAAQNTTSTTSQ